MQLLAIISGKGGTGKTSLAASFMALAPLAVGADCDVDAANLSLLLSPREEEVEDFVAGKKPAVDLARCQRCGRCQEVCRWQAIKTGEVNLIRCEGCGVCSHVCPQEAISMQDEISGQWFVSATEYGPLVHARLRPGAGNSGKLVTVVRKRAQELALSSASQWVIIDGPPGNGCPVMATLSGVKAALVVTEPSQSGLHDLGRVLDLCHQLQVRPYVCINRHDLSSHFTEIILAWCHQQDVTTLGKIPYDTRLFDSVVAGNVPVLTSDSPGALAIIELWGQLEDRLTKEG